MHTYFSYLGDRGKKKKEKCSLLTTVGALVRYEVAINLNLIYHELNLITCLERLLILGYTAVYFGE